MFHIIIRTILALAFYGWQTSAYATEIWYNPSEGSFNGCLFNGEREIPLTKTMEVIDMDPNPSEDYQTFDCSYETVTKERFGRIPHGVVREALFSQDIEHAESLLSPTILRDFIRQQPNLTKLHLDENLLRDEGITPLSTLTHLMDLSIAKNGITNFGLENVISRMTTLRSLDISRNYFDMDGLRRLNQVVANLQNFNCNFISLGDAGAEFISRNARQLQTLDFSGTSLSDKGLALLTSLDHLTKVNISYNAISPIYLADFIHLMSSRNVEVTADYMR